MNEMADEKENPVRILVVDDEEIIRDLLCDKLTQEGINVTTAKDGTEALQLIRKELFEIVITDLKMPGMSGMELLYQVVKICPDTCVIIMSAYGTVESAVQVMKSGAYDYVCKPFELEEIKFIVGKAVERQRLLRDSRMVKHYKYLSSTDGLTGVYNHRYFQEYLDFEIQSSVKNHSMFALLFADVDNFKKFNDTFGHVAGDTVLRELATLFRGKTRKTDFIARYGGEEFAIVLPDTQLIGGLRVASHIRREIQSRKWVQTVTSPEATITLSTGVVEYPRDGRLKGDLIKKADEAMYFAKKNGKNRVCYFNGGQIVEYKEI